MELQKRTEEVLELSGLQDRQDDRAGTYSGGMKRRLNLGLGVMHQPKVLLLDEPTTGVDPQSRNHIFERVKELNAAGMTVIYTSHYMEEVQALCTRIGILDQGKLIACAPLSGLLKMLKVSVSIQLRGDISTTRNRLASYTDIRIIGTHDDWIDLEGPDVSGLLVRVVNVLREGDAELVGMKSSEPDLERVFLHLTAHTLRD